MLHGMTDVFQIQYVAQQKALQYGPIVKFLIDAHRRLGIRKLRCLSFPGPAWGFEHKLRDAYQQQNATFLGIEMSAASMSQAGPHMLGGTRRHPNKATHWMSRGHEILGWENQIAQYVNIEFERFVKLDLVLADGELNLRKTFYRDLSCAWLDYDGVLSERSDRAIRHFPSCFSSRIETVPFAVSFCLSRGRIRTPENQKPLRHRAKILRDKLQANFHRDIQLVDTFSHTLSVGGMPMGTALFLATLRKDNDVPNN